MSKLTGEVAISNAKIAKAHIASLLEQEVNELLQEIGNSLINNIDYIVKENEKDVDRARLIGADTEELTITAEDIRQIAHVYFDFSTKEPHIGVKKDGFITSPMGIVATIFESSPKTIAIASAYCIKSRCGLIASGSKSLENTNKALTIAIQTGIKAHKKDTNMLQYIELHDTLAFDEFINSELDLIIPIGSPKFVDLIRENSKNICLETAVAMPYLFIDKSAGLVEVANKIILDDIKKVIIHEKVYDEVLSELKGKIGLITEPKQYDLNPYHSLHKTVVVKTENLETAIEHINTYSNGHTDIIFSNDIENVQHFIKNVNSVIPLVNSLPTNEPLEVFATIVSHGYFAGSFTIDKLVSFKHIV